MLFARIIINILAIALPSLRTSPLFFTRIATIVLLYAAALYTVYLSVVYIQSIGSGIGVYSGLFISSLLPIKPGDVKPRGPWPRPLSAVLPRTGIMLA